MICDRCDKSIPVSIGHWNQYGEPYSRYHKPVAEEEYVVIDHAWGYFSNGKDMSTHQSVLCESCYDALFKEVKIKITEY